MGGTSGGRKSQPAEVLAIKGRRAGFDSGGRPIKQPPKFARMAPEPPEWLTEEGQAEWNRVVPSLSRLDILKEEDRAVLAAYCDTWAVFVQAARDVHENGLQTVQVTTRGDTTVEKPVANPSVAIRATAARDLRSFASEYGLTPASEMKLGKVGGSSGGDDAGEEDPYAQTS